MKIVGKGVSRGICIGTARVLNEEEKKIEKEVVKDWQQELALFDQAINASEKDIRKIAEKATEDMGEEHGAIFEAHLLMLRDPSFEGEIRKAIEREKVCATFITKRISDQLIGVFKSMDNDYMRERAADLEDISGRVLNHLLGIIPTDITKLDEDVIIVAHDLTPSDTAIMDKERVLGFVTELGGPTSHTAIMARILEIPAIVGLSGVTGEIKDGDMVVIDGAEGILHINPSEATLERYREKDRVEEEEKEALKLLIDEPTVTLDGHQIKLMGNIGGPEDVDRVLANGGEGIGLFRTEFLYMKGEHLPTEEEQFTVYKEVVDKMKGKEVIVRTLDIGGDKEVKTLKLEKEANPFLGYRAIRICLAEHDLFKTQLKALLRASAFGKLKIMFPMISSLEEVREAKKLLEEAKEELHIKGKEFDEDIQVGIMIEIPSAAIIADLLAKEVDFFSIGTNDLVQYTLAVDRMNERIADLYDPGHPAVVRLIHQVALAAHKESIEVGMCGEMAGQLEFTDLLVGLGLDELSMSPNSILPMRKYVKEMKYKEVKRKAP